MVKDHRIPSGVSEMVSADKTGSSGAPFESIDCRYYGIGGMTIRVSADLPMMQNTFHPKFKPFEADGPSEEVLSIHHRFGLPDFSRMALGREVYRRAPWQIYRTKEGWCYVGVGASQPFIAPSASVMPPATKATLGNSDPKALQEAPVYLAARFDRDYREGVIYHEDGRAFRLGGHHSLTLFPTDQILLAPALAERDGCLMHAAGVVIEGRGFLFVGHSAAGKTTVATLLRDRGTILCDDRIILRRGPDGFRIFGTWSHGDLPDVSPEDAALTAIVFLEKSDRERLTPIRDRRKVVRGLLACLIRPLPTARWWDRMLGLTARISAAVPCYTLYATPHCPVAELLQNRDETTVP